MSADRAGCVKRLSFLGTKASQLGSLEWSRVKGSCSPRMPYGCFLAQLGEHPLILVGSLPLLCSARGNGHRMISRRGECLGPADHDATRIEILLWPCLASSVSAVLPKPQLHASVNEAGQNFGD